SGGTTPYLYSWDDPDFQTTDTADSLCEGTYQVVVTDDNNCEDSANVTVSEPSEITLTTEFDSSTCGNSDGEARVSASGGAGGFSFQWDDPSNQIDDTATGLSASTYQVVVTDANTCKDSTNVTVKDKSSPTTQMVDSTMVSCNGENDGDAKVEATSGTPPYSYSWSGGTQNDSVVSDLSAGTYTVDVTDDNGCVSSEDVTITEPAALNTSMSKTDVTCNGVCDGDATVNVSGGTSPYDYSWNNSSDTTSSADSLCAGKQKVTVTDSNNCVIEDSVDISEPTALSLSDSIVNTSCNGVCEGELHLTASGGTGSYEFSNDTGTTYQGDSSFKSLCAKSYDLIVKDDNSCKDTITSSVGEPGEITFTANKDSVSCKDSCDGQIEFATISGGTSPYQYSIDNGSSFKSDSVFNDLCKGTFNLIVKDTNDCDDSGSVTVKEPDDLSFSTTIDSASCFGSCDGQIEFSTVNGGTAPFDYSIDDGTSWQNDSVFNNLCADTFDLKIRDTNACKENNTVIVKRPDSLDFTVDIDSASCKGVCDGKIEFTSVSGGTSPYEYSIDNGSSFQNDSAFDSLCAGSYDLIVRDANGCEDSATVSVEEPGLVNFNVNTDSVSCNGNCDGAIKFTSMSGGTTPYEFSIDNGSSYKNDSDFTGLCDSTFNLIVKDKNGCDDSSTATVNEPDPLAYTTDLDSTTCNGKCDGKIEFTSVSGGTSPYDHSIDNGNNFFNDSTIFTGQCAGGYDLVVRDTNGCTKNISVTLDEPDPLSFNKNIDSASCADICDGKIEFTSTSGGTSPYEYSIDSGSSFQGNNTFTGLCDSTYDLILRDNNNCEDSAIATVNEPDTLNFTTDIDSASCAGVCDGKIDFTSLNGGTKPYEFSIDDGASYQNDSDYTGLCDSTYNLKLRDANSCVDSTTASVKEP
ncbi:MAG: SprB repeat-containing protein, partial [Flavobacteriales bacterium]